MCLCDGVLLVLDQNATPFDRIWCCFEQSVALTDHLGRNATKFLLDIATTLKKTGAPERAVVLVEGLTRKEREVEEHCVAEGLPEGAGWKKKMQREKAFPMAIIERKGLSIDIENAAASHPIDRIRILNSIAKTSKGENFEDSELDKPPPEKDSSYAEISHGLSAIFALAAWPHCPKRAQRELIIESLRRDTVRRYLDLHHLYLGCEVFDQDLIDLGTAMPKKLTELALDFEACAHIGDAGLAGIATGLPACLQSLNLDVRSCTALSDKGMQELAQRLPSSLATLHLHFGGCLSISDVGLISLAQALPASLETLFLGLGGCKLLSDVGLGALAHGLPPLLSKLEILAWGCRGLTDPGIAKLSEEASRNDRPLETLYLDIGGNVNISDVGIKPLAQSLPASLKSLELKLWGSFTGDESFICLLQNLPAALEVLRLNFQGALSIGSGQFSSLEDVPKLPKSLHALAFCFNKCLKVNDDFLKSLGKTLPDDLDSLCITLSSCSDITGTGISYLQNCLPTSLVELELDLDNCGQVKESAVQALVDHLHPMVYNELDSIEIRARYTGVSPARLAAFSKEALARSFKEKRSELTDGLTKSGKLRLAMTYKKNFVESHQEEKEQHLVDLLMQSESSSNTTKEKALQRVSEIFQQFDADHSGTISKAEFVSILSRLSDTKLNHAMTVQQIDKIFELADANKDGGISYNELLWWVSGGDVEDEQSEQNDDDSDDLF
eukprot:gnl/TRDRNA2_/TRDRNA2_121026_c1_seq1.p1 gnl/TRDRNA2_/TRDRNA2_121026_c1~~gnl/TRDRNA2_/TRDRNA2_121026_c1_seq1.p1  ORF type:complete len:741 (-),score=135.83 gnl/TRDRNA2_/TRDRNA2_121026_c1_seq1:78-2258(-)